MPTTSQEVTTLNSEAIPLSELPELQEELRQMLENPEVINRWKCPACGCSGLHACMGRPMPEWTQEDKDKLTEVLRSFGWK